MADIWAKIGGAVKKGARATKDVLFLVPKALIYPIKKPFASWGEMKHDAKVSLKEAVGMGVPEKEKKYDPPIETTKASKNLGVETSYKDGKVKFLASRTLTGDIPYLTPEQLGKIEELNKNKENKYSSITVFREENKVVIEVDVKEVTNNIKNDPKHKGKSPEEIKKLVIEGIYGEVDRNLKGLAKITGGEFKVHTDRKLLHGIAEKLYRKYDEQLSKAAKSTEKLPEQSSETAVPNKSSSTMKSSETVKKEDFNMTNPLLAYYQEVADGKINGVKFPSKEQQDILGKLGSGLSNPEDASDKPKEPLSTPTVEGNGKREKGGRPH
ncbi:MAG: hypothetical protein LKM43_03525 [Wolbachia endosymbiont of Penenirmus auritus]|nr:hypothetical protein [Wolbachia endosymbiont of Penenirmus auritus]